MKKLFYLLIIVGLAVTSCNKPEQLPLEQDVTFKAVAFESGFKSDDICNAEVAHYAILTISDPGGANEYNEIIDIFYLGTTMYTNTLKLNPGDYELQSFILMNYGDDNAFEGGDDVIVYASPDAGSDNSQIVQGLPVDFTVGVFTKNEVNIEVLCFDELNYSDFGFSWFAIDFTDVDNNDLVFFGDFCTKYFADYATSLYNGQANGLNHDMPAIFKIDVYDTDGFVISYNNETWLGDGAPLIVTNPDDPLVDGENFKFVLSILVKNGTDTFIYKEFYTWTRTDSEALYSLGATSPFIIGDDNVIDFVLGSCVPDADLILPPYMDLPATATLLTGPQIPGSLGTYFDVTLSDFSGTALGHDIKEEMVGVYCADYINSVALNTTYSNMNVISSLYPEDLPTAYDSQKIKLSNLNWLGNNFSLYGVAGIDYTWKDVQNAIWMILGEITETNTDVDTDTPTAMAIRMKNDANNNGTGYLPPVGGWAAVLFAKTDASLQLIFTLVDP